MGCVYFRGTSHAWNCYVRQFFYSCLFHRGHQMDYRDYSTVCRDYRKSSRKGVSINLFCGHTVSFNTVVARLLFARYWETFLNLLGFESSCSPLASPLQLATHGVAATKATNLVIFVNKTNTNISQPCHDNFKIFS